jgi:hypothetical protein
LKTILKTGGTQRPNVISEKREVTIKTQVYEDAESFDEDDIASRYQRVDTDDLRKESISAALLEGSFISYGYLTANDTSKQQ